MIQNISSEKLVEELKSIELQERALEEDALARLTELHRRGYALRLGYPSLFEFCVKVLGYSQGKASRRVQGLRLLESVSDAKGEDVKDKLKEGTLTLTHLCQLQSVARKTRLTIEKKEEMLTRLEGTSVREAEKVLTSEFGVAAITRESIRPLSDEASKMTLVVDQETLQLLEEFKNLTGHQNPQGSLAEALKLALKMALDKKRPKPPSFTLSFTLPLSPAAKQNLVPAPVRITASTQRVARGQLRAAVWKRDRGKCRICGSAYMLEVDHIVPYAQGGKTELGNLRLLCRAHHRMREVA